MIVSTTNAIEGMRIIEDLGYIEAKSSALAINLRESARKNLEKKAEKIGANAIIGFEIKDTIGINIFFKIFSAHASGTAVVVE